MTRHMGSALTLAQKRISRVSNMLQCDIAASTSPSAMLQDCNQIVTSNNKWDQKMTKHCSNDRTKLIILSCKKKKKTNNANNNYNNDVIIIILIHRRKGLPPHNWDWYSNNVVVHNAWTKPRINLFIIYSSLVHLDKKWMRPPSVIRHESMAESHSWDV